MNEFLMRFIDSYDVFVHSINGIASLMFGVSVYLLANAFGVKNDFIVEKFPSPWFLWICMIFCVITFASNFLIQGTIANFFSDLYKQDMDRQSTTETVCESASPDTPLDYFHTCVRENGLSTLAVVSLLSSLVASLLITIWVLMAIRKGFVANPRVPQAKGDTT